MSEQISSLEHCGFLLRAVSSEIPRQDMPTSGPAQRYTAVVEIQSIPTEPALSSTRFCTNFRDAPRHSHSEALDAALQLGRHIVEVASHQSRRPPGNSQAVLIAEDQPELLAATVALLQDANFTVLSAPSERAALELLDGDGPIDVDVLFSDFLVSGQTGKHLALEAVQRRANIGIVLTSSYAIGQNVPPQWLCLQKPYLIGDLITALRRA